MRKIIFTLVAIMAVMFVSCGGGGSNDPIPYSQVKSIEVSPKNMTLHLGPNGLNETQFLKAKVYPAEAQHSFTWLQSDYLVAQGYEYGGDSLMVHACEVGETDIVLEEAYSGLKDTCHVTVTDEIVPVEKISFDTVTFDLYSAAKINKILKSSLQNSQFNTIKFSKVPHKILKSQWNDVGKTEMNGDGSR